MASSVAANGSPLSIHWNGSRDVRNASKVGEPENIVPASSVVKQVSTKRTMFQTGPRERRRGGARRRVAVGRREWVGGQRTLGHILSVSRGRSRAGGGGGDGVAAGAGASETTQIDDGLRL